MNIGGMAFISDKIIRLDEELLRPLTLRVNSSVSGVYYPPREEESYGDRKTKHDFMITPIPYYAWPYCLGIRLTVKHDRGSLDVVADYFKENRINIHMSHMTRTGYLYGIWNLVVELEQSRLQKEFDGYNDFRSSFSQLKEYSDQLENKIQDYC